MESIDLIETYVYEMNNVMIQYVRKKRFDVTT